MVLIAVPLQISLKSDLGSVGRASTVALSHSFDISLSLSWNRPGKKTSGRKTDHRPFWMDLLFTLIKLIMYTSFHTKISNENKRFSHTHPGSYNKQTSDSSK